MLAKSSPMNKEGTQLVFVYNADSGLGNAMLDAAHKIVNPDTYSCSLCQLTYGAIREKSNWKRFRKETSIPMQFLHKNEFANTWGEEGADAQPFPAIFLATRGQLQLVIEDKELDAMTSEVQLMQRVEEIIASIQHA